MWRASNYVTLLLRHLRRSFQDALWLGIVSLLRHRLGFGHQRSARPVQVWLRPAYLSSPLISPKQPSAGSTVRPVPKTCPTQRKA